MTREVVLVRFGEIFLKGQNRGSFERRLLDNARVAARTVGGSVERTHGRLLAWPAADGGGEKLARAVARVFGVSSLSPARVVERDLERIAEAAIELSRTAASGRARPPTFKVEARRSDKRFLPTSPEIARTIGGKIATALGLPVDVHTPELQVGVEIGYEHAFVFAHTLPGPGGLPVGMSGRVELLLSGGIDSPVAGWMMLKRGCQLGATYFHSFPYTGEKTRDKVARLARALAGWQLEPIRLAVVPFTAVQKSLREACGDGRLAVVLYRRMMLRVAAELGRAAGALALVTGEALAQVASQTLENLTVIGEAATLPVLRPCLGHDKLDTIAIAERIGTYALSIEPYDDCCSLFVPEHPETRARLRSVQLIESRLDIAQLVESCVKGVERIECAP